MTGRQPARGAAQAISAAVDYPTPAGNAHLALDVPAHPLAVLVLGHGAGGDIDAPDLLAVRDAALPHRVAVVRVRQPYRVAGRRAPAPAAQLDRAFAAVLAGTADLPGLRAGLPLFVGGRSSGARVAARTASAAGAAGLLALAFPLRPPGRPLVDRLPELTEAAVPALVVQGSRDAFGSDTDVRDAVAGFAGLLRAVVDVSGVPGADHSFRARRSDLTTTGECLAAVSAAAGSWLSAMIAAG